MNGSERNGRRWLLTCDCETQWPSEPPGWEIHGNYGNKARECWWPTLAMGINDFFTINYEERGWDCPRLNSWKTNSLGPDSLICMSLSRQSSPWQNAAVVGKKPQLDWLILLLASPSSWYSPSDSSFQAGSRSAIRAGVPVQADLQEVTWQWLVAEILGGIFPWSKVGYSQYLLVSCRSFVQEMLSGRAKP